MAFNRVAFLRAVNVGGRQVSMQKLAELFGDLGFPDAKTVLNSGNVLFSARSSAKKLEALLEAETENRFGLSTSYFVRTGAEMSALVDANPFPRQARDDPARLVVFFLKDAPPAIEARKLISGYGGPEIVKLDGRHAYVYYPDGQGNSKFKFPWHGSARNWNTVLKIAGAIS